MRRSVLASWALCAFVGATAAQADLPAGPEAPRRAAPRIGEAFGPLRLPTIDGDQWIDLASFRGKKVLLIEFASW